jgi:hypothetical protein
VFGRLETEILNLDAAIRASLHLCLADLASLVDAGVLLYSPTAFSTRPISF